MKLFIMQPNFLPWIGFFDMVNLCDKFVFLDDVKVSKNSWINRNKIKTKNGLEWIKLPIKNNQNKLINKLEIYNEKKFLKKLIFSINQNYNKSSYFKKFENELFDLLEDGFKNGNLCNLNQNIIFWAFKKFKINKQVFRSSELNIIGKKNYRIVEICKKLDITTYITTPGSVDYLREDINLYKENKIKVAVHNYVHPEYFQLYNNFISHACFLDILFNEGHNASNIIYKGSKKLHELN